MVMCIFTVEVPSQQKDASIDSKEQYEAEQDGNDAKRHAHETLHQPMILF